MVTNFNPYDQYVDKEDWALLKKKDIFEPNVWKCNKFVQDAIREVKNKDITVKVKNQYIGHPNTEYFFNEKIEIPNLIRVKSLPVENDNATYVICIENKENDGSRHCGIYYNGYVIHACEFKVKKNTIDSYKEFSNGKMVYLKLIE